MSPLAKVVGKSRKMQPDWETLKAGVKWILKLHSVLISSLNGPMGKSSLWPIRS